MASTQVPAADRLLGLRMLGRTCTLVDHRPALIDAQFAGGMTYLGPFEARSNDDMGIAVGKTYVNSRVTWSEMSQYSAGQAPAPIETVKCNGANCT